MPALFRGTPFHTIHSFYHKNNARHQPAIRFPMQQSASAPFISSARRGLCLTVCAGCCRCIPPFLSGGFRYLSPDGHMIAHESEKRKARENAVKVARSHFILFSPDISVFLTISRVVTKWIFLQKKFEISVSACKKYWKCLGCIQIHSAKNHFTAEIFLNTLFSGASRSAAEKNLQNPLDKTVLTVYTVYEQLTRRCMHDCLH